MKSIVIFLLIIAGSLNLNAQLTKSPSPQPSATPAYVLTQTALAAKLSPGSFTLLRRKINEDGTKQRSESLTCTSPTVTTTALQFEQALSQLVHKKIAQLYPKWPLHAFPYLIAHEIEIQQKLASEKSEQEITLDINTQFALEVAYQCIPILNNTILQLKRMNSSLKDADSKGLLEQTVLSINQKINTISQELYHENRPAQFHVDDFEGVYCTYETIKALADPKDRLLIVEIPSSDRVLEKKPAVIPATPTPAKPKAKPPAKKDICVIC